MTNLAQQRRQINSIACEVKLKLTNDGFMSGTSSNLEKYKGICRGISFIYIFTILGYIRRSYPARTCCSCPFWQMSADSIRLDIACSHVWKIKFANKSGPYTLLTDSVHVNGGLGLSTKRNWVLTETSITILPLLLRFKAFSV